MAIDFLSENSLAASEATRLFPSWKKGKPTHVSRVIRAIRQGAPGPDGERVYLEAVRLNGQWITTAEAVQRFLERLSPRHPGVDDRRTPTARTRAAERAEAELAALGV